MKRPIYSRWSAVSGAFIWLVAFLTTLVLLLGAVSTILGSSEALSGVWSLSGPFIALILIVVIWLFPAKRGEDALTS